MSFMFQRNKKRSGTQRSNSFERRGFGNMRGGGGGGGSGGGSSQGQTMLYRQRAKPKKAAMVTPQAQQRKSQAQESAISMAEVMADLRILDEQQRESQRKLESARATKQRRMEQHGALEAKLREYKYQHGQNRAELQRIHEKLSQAQRLLGQDRLHVQKAGDNLREFDSQLKQALETKRRIACHDRVGAAKIAQLRRILAALDNVKKDARQQVDTAQREYEQLQEQESSFRQGVRDRTAELQLGAEETAAVRTENARIEAELNELLQAAAVRQEEKDHLKQQSTAATAQQDKLVEASKKTVAAQTKFLQEVEPKVKREQEVIAAETEKLQKLEEEVAQIQVDEKHVAPSDTLDRRTAKQFDVHLVRASEEAEAKALSDEEASKKTLEEKTTALREQLKAVQTEEQILGEKASKQAALVEEAKRTEKSRRQEYLDFVKQLESAKHEVETLRGSIVDYEKQNEKRIAELQEKTGGLRMAIFKVKAEIDTDKGKLVEADEHVLKASENYENAKKSNTAKVDKMKQKLASRQKKQSKLATQAGDKEMQLAKAGTSKPPAIEDASTPDEIKAEIAQLHDRFPILLEITSKYEPHKTIEEQQAEALQFVFEHCDQREKSAKKMRRELKAAAEREKKERKKIEQAAAAEKLRQREAREKRQKRLAAESENSAPPTAMPEAESAAKPRALLAEFTKASQEDTIDFEVEDGGKISEPETKKVHWEDGSHDTPDKQDAHILGTDTKSRRKSFGGLSKTKSKPASTKSRSTLSDALDEAERLHSLEGDHNPEHPVEKENQKKRRAHSTSSLTSKSKSKSSRSGAVALADASKESKREGTQGSVHRSSKRGTSKERSALAKNQRMNGSLGAAADADLGGEKERSSSNRQLEHKINNTSKSSKRSSASRSGRVDSNKIADRKSKEKLLLASEDPTRKPRSRSHPEVSSSRKTSTLDKSSRNQTAVEKHKSSRSRSRRANGNEGEGPVEIGEARKDRRSITGEMRASKDRNSAKETLKSQNCSALDKKHAKERDSRRLPTERSHSDKLAASERGRSRSRRHSDKSDRAASSKERKVASMFSRREKDDKASLSRATLSRRNSKERRLASKTSKFERSHTRPPTDKVPKPSVSSKSVSTSRRQHSKTEQTASGKRKEPEKRVNRTSGTSSLERANKSRRRKRAQSAGTSKAKSFDQDVSFNFLAE